MTDFEKALAIMEERFGRDRMISLATAVDNLPSVRDVNGYYRDGSFYIITHALSGKMQQIAKNPHTAICGEWFSGYGIGENLGYFDKPENARIALRLREIFSAWIYNGHNNFSDKNTILLRITLTGGVLFSHGTRYDL